MENKYIGISINKLYNVDGFIIQFYKVGQKFNDIENNIFNETMLEVLQFLKRNKYNVQSNLYVHNSVYRIVFKRNIKQKERLNTNLRKIINNNFKFTQIYTVNY